MNPIQAMSSILPPGGRRPFGEIGSTSTQRGETQAIISKYDPNQFSDRDSQAMRAELREAGIPPSEDLKNLLESAGFEVLGGQRGALENSSDLPPFARDFASRHRAGSLDEMAVAGIREQMRLHGPMSRGILFDQRA